MAKSSRASPGDPRSAPQPTLEAVPPSASAGPANTGRGTLVGRQVTEDRPKTTRRRPPIEAKANPALVYLSPEAKLALKRCALVRGPKVKVHDLLIEALEEWGERRGIQVTWRVPSAAARKIVLR